MMGDERTRRERHSSRPWYQSGWMFAIIPLVIWLALIVPVTLTAGSPPGMKPDVSLLSAGKAVTPVTYDDCCVRVTTWWGSTCETFTLELFNESCLETHGVEIELWDPYAESIETTMVSLSPGETYDEMIISTIDTVGTTIRMYTPRGMYEIPIDVPNEEAFRKMREPTKPEEYMKTELV